MSGGSAEQALRDFKDDEGAKALILLSYINSRDPIEGGNGWRD
ncbi:MAG: hypothetical protein WDM70_10090 [Nitrosomonadales bacterium]